MVLKNRSVLGVALALVLGTAGAASAQNITVFGWQPVQMAEQRMEKEKVPGLYYFDSTYERMVKASLDNSLQHPQIQEKMVKFACMKIQADLGGGKSIWGQNAKLANKFGVGTTSAIVFTTYDGYTLGVISQIIKRDDFGVYLSKILATNSKRVKDSEQADRELEQAEKWIDEQKYADAVRRAKVVIKKGESEIDAKTLKRANDLDEKLKKLCVEKLAAAKKLAEDPAKQAEAKAALQEIVTGFASYEESKEAKELLKKID